ncbi:MAG: DNA polymerase IV [Ruminococcaceae bacterium]|nr:DNA polymerase IV [Oscillospiraceae bacterium]
MDRVILHVDMNNFFASVECADRPELWSQPVAVAGDVQARHGIILAKNQVAKAYGVQTGESIAEARRKCPRIVLLPPHMDRYQQISDKARAIYAQYTDRVESFGIDECWLDVTGNGRLWGENYGEVIANEIRTRIKAELGVTVSVGVSFNKIFAKMGSDYKKPDAVTLITRENFRELLWPLPVGDLIFVGRSTAQKLWYMQIRTVGDLARAEPDLLERTLGKSGLMAWNFANGMDGSPVLHDGQEYPIKSIGNSTTTPVDMVTRRDAEIVLAQLCQSVATRLREADLRCTTVKLSLRTTDLSWKQRQKGTAATCLENDLWREAMTLYDTCHDGKPLRSIGVAACNLTPNGERQLCMFDGQGETCRHAALESLGGVLDSLRERFGARAVRRGLLLEGGILIDGVPPQGSMPHPVAWRK